MHDVIPVPWEGLCECGKWHRADECVVVHAEFNLVSVGWVVDYALPCGRRITTWDADRAGMRAPRYLHDAFRKRRAVVPDTVTCSRCREALQENAEAFWLAWQKGNDTNIEPHARIGSYRDGTKLCELRVC